MRTEIMEGPKCAGCGKELKPNDMVYEYMLEGRKSFTHANVDCWVQRAKKAVKSEETTELQDV